MKNIFAIALLLNANLYTMDYVPKKHTSNQRDPYVQLLDMNVQEVYDAVKTTTIRDIQRKYRVSSGCVPSITRFIIRSLRDTRDYLLN